ncbi:hypothetical protein [Pseudoalteromonas luteoviolacea]|uniref:Uncharacterized protein n=1 Tax=Pseudoalteromonas luteoviolacea S4054 TaxID=1129367 RepID=A0A0F6AHJ4_9GAMM|nr:hypothetical protein [Pseudoalteromonas luteoviolacea]AOT10442.1 hypothetical protein S4054249_21470 [Pseudoalteromonas luteoviolacea]AOT15488.1 hypothetical protein S40542_22120 [Pseudoalteromonas luteoviolacea]AOT20261.1 hypothetical protein S4054_21385 [Pseudoalteromonas luteoviolacea]KKE85682.1 hypothetical protein N479_25165 [Pseudoalteromonas luteoviolacea S4054]KZN73174.1 hypothetical protein N481_13205 [Pseudoalteromonas luteoviolacea S4047-1]
MNLILRFGLSILIVIAAFIVSATLAGVFAEAIGIWKKPTIGSVAAVCVVLSGYASAPKYKLAWAALWLFVGAVAAWGLSNAFMYAEDAGTQAPLIITYASGVFSLMVCRVWHKRNSHRISTK